MVKTASTMLPLGAGTRFLAAGHRGKRVSLADFADAPALLVIFLCNHCPYVKHVADGPGRAGARNTSGAAWPWWESTRTTSTSYPEDSPAKMAEEAKLRGYTFPYLYDETQAVAKAYRAACTPDFYVFDRERKLVYRGQMDSSRPGGDSAGHGRRPPRGAGRGAGQPAGPDHQKPSLGCNIKWKPGNEPDYFL